MMKHFLKETQPVVYRTLYRAFQEQKIPHAFLLVSKKGIDVHGVALFLAQSLICEQDVLACEQCEDCQRLAQGHFIDLKCYDGKVQRIKKKDIETIQEAFTKSSVEGKAKIYLLEHIDDATPEAMNSLLKMLEEPTDGIYAILTCDNLNRVLPTIQSRTQLIHFREISQEALAKQAIALGVKEEDALILAQIYASPQQIKQAAEEERYQQLKVEALNFVEDYFTKRENLLINAQTHVLKKFTQKEDIHIFLDLLFVLFKDVLYHAYGLKIAFSDHVTMMTSWTFEKEQLIGVLEKILATKEAIQSNANLMLLMDRMIVEL